MAGSTTALTRAFTPLHFAPGRLAPPNSITPLSSQAVACRFPQHFSLSRGLAQTRARRSRWEQQRGQSQTGTTCASLHSSGAQIREAAIQTVDFFVKSGDVVGLGCGPGSTVAIEYIGSKLKDGSLRNVVGVPISTESAANAARVGLPLTAMHPELKLKVAFDDADLVQEGTVNTIMGRRAPDGSYKSIIKEKEIAAAAETYVLMIDSSTFVDKLSGAVPVIIKPEEWEETAEELDDLFLGDAEIWRRPSHGVAGPSGGDRPLVTEQGYHILDIIFTEPIEDPVATAKAIEGVPGVVAHGLFLENIYAAAVGTKDGVKIRTSLFRSMFEEPRSSLA